MGSIVQYDFFGSAAHDLSENQTHLFDTGVKSPTSFARQQFNAAGWYTTTDSPSGRTQSVRIAPSGPATATSRSAVHNHLVGESAALRLP